MSEQQLLKAKLNAIQEGLNSIVQRLKEIEDTWNNIPPEERVKMGLDAAELNKLSWTPFKQAKGEWIFSKDAPKLKDALLKNKGKLDFEGYHYKLSGEDDLFINRFPMSEHK